MLKEPSAAANDEAVQQSANYRSELYALEHPKAEEGEGENNAQKTADAIVAGLELVYIGVRFCGYFLNKKLVGAGRNVSVEDQRYTD